MKDTSQRTLKVVQTVSSSDTIESAIRFLHDNGILSCPVVADEASAEQAIGIVDAIRGCLDTHARLRFSCFFSCDEHD